MVIPLDRPILCPTLVGRTAHLEALEDVLHSVQGGEGRAILIAGEAGIGKTRLIHDARARAERLGFQILEGRCFEPDRSLPYAPFLDLLRTLCTTQPLEEVIPHLGNFAPELIKLLPELADRLADVAPSVPLGPDQERHRFVHTLTEFLARLAREHPVLVVLEDLHWGDESSLDLLLSLARRLTACPILLLATYRTDEVTPDLRYALAGLDRERLVVELELKRLTVDEVDRMIRAIFSLDRRVPVELLTELYALTEGNPFFLEEVLKSLVSAGETVSPDRIWDQTRLAELHMPRSVEDAVQRRLRHVPPAAQRVLRLAAVAGRRFDFALLQELAGQEEDELLGHLRELIAAQLVVEESDERLAFRHALTRQAIYGQLLVRERKALHRGIAETIERLYPESLEAHLPDLAYHSYEGGIWDRALDYAQRVGARAQAMYAPAAAIEHFSHAFQASERLGQEPPTSLYRGRGQAYETAGDFERALNDFERGLRAARAAEDRGAEWQSLLDLGFLWSSRDQERAGALFRQALEFARGMDEPARLAQSLNRVGNWYANMDLPHQGQELHEQALALFEQQNDQPGIAQTLDFLGVVAHIVGDRRGSIAHFEEAAALFRALDEPRALASILATLGHLRSTSAVFDTLAGATRSSGQPLRECEDALTTARAIGWRSGEAYALGEVAACLSGEGRYDRALPAAWEGLAVAEEIGHGQWLGLAHCNLGMIYLDLLASDLARLHLEQSYAYAAAAGSPHLSGITAAFLARGYLLGQETARAEGVLGELVGADSPVATLAQSLLLAAYAELSLARGDPEAALRIADRLILWAEQSGGPGVVPRLWMLRGDALLGLGAAGEAEAALRAAAETAGEQGCRPLLWRIYCSLGGALQARARRVEAEQAYAGARTIVEELAVTIPDDALRDGFLSRALARIPGPRPLSPQRAAKQQYGGLTAREREVATLIARGLSNRQIAKALVVSERTVEAHSGHIRDKLGFTSRAQVAAWAVEKGLAGQ